MARQSKRVTDGRHGPRPQVVLVRKLVCITREQNQWLRIQARAKRLGQGEFVRRILNRMMGVRATA